MDAAPQPLVIRSLLLSVELGETEKVKEYITEKNISVEISVDDEGNSLLHIAAANGHYEIVRFLTIKGASLDRTNLYGWTALMQACRYGHTKSAAHLINSKADVNATNIMGLNALSLAIYGGFNKITEILLSNEKLSIDDDTAVASFLTPIHIATYQGRDGCLRKLLVGGCPADQYYKYTKFTPLMLAALTGQLTMARLLVDKGADTNFKNKLGKTALEIAMDCDMKEIRGYLDRKTTVKPERVVERGDSIITAVKKGDLEKTLKFLQLDASSANKASADGATPLMYASINGYVRMIDLLISHGADIDAKDYENGWTALMQATYYGKTQAATRLIQAGANVGLKTHNGVTAFDMAMLINLNDTTLFRLLAEKAMINNFNEEDKQHDTQITKAWQTNNNTHQMRVDLIGSQQSINKLNSNQASSKRGLWSKMSRTMKGMKITKTLKNLTNNKKVVNNFEETLIAPDENDLKYNSKTDTVSRVVPYEVTYNGAPTAHVPKDKLSPIVPPFQQNTGVDQQTMKTQRKLSSSSNRNNNSLNSSGESSVSRNIVRPFKFLHTSPNSSTGGRHSASLMTSYSSLNSHKSVRSLGNPTTTTRPISRGGKSDDRHSDTVISKINKREQRKRNHLLADSRRTRNFQQKQVGTDAKEEIISLNSSNSFVSSHSSSTLTPPPPSICNNSPMLRYNNDKMNRAKSIENKNVPASYPDEEDEIKTILRKLSLENYQPIFEEQEIDMESFLTLTQQDLCELGITQELPRRQILKVIDKMNANEN